MLLSAYLDSELTGREMLAIRHHLSDCRDCESELDSLREVKYLLSSLPLREAAPEAMVQLSRRLAFESLTWLQKLEYLFSHTLSGETFVQGRRIASAFALSGLALFLLTGSFDEPGSDRSASQMIGLSSPSLAHPAGFSEGNFYFPSFTDVRFLDPSRHSADLPSEGETQFVNIAPSRRYNNSVESMPFLRENLVFVPNR